MLTTYVKDDSPLLEVRRVVKRFPGVQALDEVSLTLGRGEVLAVIGENGAGKSTLMKILAGVESADQGTFRLEGAEVCIDSVTAALGHGIALIHQELNLADNLDVAANVFLGREPTWCGPLRLVRRRRLLDETDAWLHHVGLDVPATTLVRKLSIGRQQLVEIAKALSTGARILIMDEPTSSLSQHETERLFAVIGELKARGVSIVYISHRLGEVKELADRVVVLRDGKNAGELARAEIDHDHMVRLMVGRDVSQFYQRRPHQRGEPVLDVCRLRLSGSPQHPLSFTLHRGELLGIAGLVGAGRTELLRGLFGIDPILGGKVRLFGQPYRPRTPRAAIQAGLALVPEDRKLQGLVLEMGVAENITLAGLYRLARAGFVQRRRERELARQLSDRLRVRTPSLRQLVQLLSGGNQQKVALAKCLLLEPGVLLLDEPTRGIDVGAKEEIYGLMEHLAEEGMAILFVSSEMQEILGIADRVLVMHEGRITGELQHHELSEQAVMQLATGGAMS